MLKLVKHKNYLIFFTNPSNNSWGNHFLEGKTILGHNYKLNVLKQILSTNYKGKWFLIMKIFKSSRNCFCCRSSFLKGSSTTKKLDMELEETFSLFFENCLSSSLEGLLISSNFKKYYHDLNLHVSNELYD